MSASFQQLLPAFSKTNNEVESIQFPKGGAISLSYYLPFSLYSIPILDSYQRPVSILAARLCPWEALPHNGGLEVELGHRKINLAKEAAARAKRLRRCGPAPDATPGRSQQIGPDCESIALARQAQPANTGSVRTNHRFWLQSATCPIR